MVSMLKTVVGRILGNPHGADASLRSRMLTDTERYLNQRLPKTSPAWPQRAATGTTNLAPDRSVSDRANPCERKPSRIRQAGNWR
jgi:hypothetical protein